MDNSYLDDVSGVAGHSSDHSSDSGSHEASGGISEREKKENGGSKNREYVRQVMEETRQNIELWQGIAEAAAAAKENGRELAKRQRQVAPVRLELLVTIVDRKKADFYADLLQSFDINMQMIVAAKGTAGEKMLEYLGLADNDRAIIFSAVREDRLDDIEEALSEKFRTVKDGKGVAASIPMSSIMGAASFGFFSNEREMFKGDNA